ncbi:MAG: PD40 domain-containing protein [Acidobacteria bacterium]|nr:PD40 domain-containing protein [Acidobacteriota bacterium]
MKRGTKIAISVYLFGGILTTLSGTGILTRAPGQSHSGNISIAAGRASPSAGTLHTGGLAMLASLPNPRGAVVVARRSRLAARGLQEAEKPIVTSLQPSSGGPGTKVEIEGQFFSAGRPKENVVTFGGVQAAVSEVTETRIVTQVPEGAMTGRVIVTTPWGKTSGDHIFTVTVLASGRFEPPAGINAADFDIVNAYGPVRSLSIRDNVTEFAIPVPKDVPLVVVSAPKDLSRQTFFYAVTLSDQQPLTIDATSTAEALVFISPFFLTTETLIAERILNIIRQDDKVRVFAQVIGQLYPLYSQGGDPFTDPVFTQAYAEALLSVGQSGEMRSLGKDRQRAIRQEEEQRLHQLFNLDLDFLQVRGSERQIQVQGIPLNPVDWLAVVYELDDQFFLNGYTSVREAVPLLRYPAKGAFRAQRYIPADLLFRRFNIIAELVNLIRDALTDALADESIDLPDRDAIYLLRGIGPGYDLLDGGQEFSFVSENFASDQENVIILNLANATLDFTNAFLGLSDLPFELKLLIRSTMIDTARASVRAIYANENKGEEFIHQSVASARSLLHVLADYYTRRGLTRLAEASGKAAGAFIGSKALVLLSAISAFGQVAERASGLLRTTPLESAFIVVGNPFQLEVVRVDPPSGFPGQEINVVIRNARFQRQNPRDRVIFGHIIGGVFEELDGTVTAVQDLPDGQQELTVRLPREFEGLIDDTYDLVVLAQGRRGTSQFRVVSFPFVDAMTPGEGFAAADEFGGQPFEGTEVTLEGFGFSPEDFFSFEGDPENSFDDAEVTRGNRSGSDGNVTLRVPKNAKSGRIRILHNFETRFGEEQREGKSQPFLVFGVPVIEAMTPDRGPVGTIVTCNTRNIGSDVSALRIFFGDTEAAPVEILAVNRLQVLVPPQTPPDDMIERTLAVALATPAGRTQRNFTLEPGRARGGSINFGGFSPISLVRALELAGGKTITSPEQLPESERPFVTLPVGAVFADIVSGEGSGIVTLNNPFDTLSGTIEGSLRVEGNNQVINVMIRGSSGCAVVVLGNNNQLQIRSDGYDGSAICIRGGKSNVVEASLERISGDGVVLEGDAVGNKITVHTGAIDPNTGQVIPKSGCGVHGVALFDGTSNIIGGSVSANGGDGVLLLGEGVRNNVIQVTAKANAGNGITINNVSDNTFFVEASENTNGIAVVGNSKRNRISADCSRNREYGLLVRDVSDVWNVASAGEPPIVVHGSGNKLAGALIEGSTSGLHVQFFFYGSDLGLLMTGADVVSNFAIGEFFNCVIGAVLRDVQRNRLSLQASECQGKGAGIGVFGAKDNELIVAASRNQGDGLLLNGSERNRVTGIFVQNRNGVVVEGGSKDNVLTELRSDANKEHGIVLRGVGTKGNQIIKARVGLSIGGEPGGNGGDGIRIEDGASDNFIGTGSSSGQELAAVEIRNNVKAGIRVTGSGGEFGAPVTGTGTRNNHILGCLITLGSSGREQEAGIVVEDLAEHTIIGGAAGSERNVISFNTDGIIVRGKAQKTVIQNNLIQANSSRGMVVDDAQDVLIGGPDPASSNEISFNPIGMRFEGANAACRVAGNRVFQNTDGIFIHSPSNVEVVNNVIKLNERGIIKSGMDPKKTDALGTEAAARTSNRFLQNTVQENRVVGMLFMDGAVDGEVRGNTVTGNGAGVQVEGPTTVRNSIRNNTITANAGKGISLRNGGNREIPPPLLESSTSNSIIGTANAPDGSTVELYQDSADEGEIPIATAAVFKGRFSVPVDLNAAQQGLLFNLTATVTDPQGNTSEFGRSSAPTATVSQIVFTSTRDGDPEIYLTDAFRLFPARLTNNPADDFSPAFSPDGSRIAFVSTRDANTEIYIMPSQGSPEASRLTNHLAPDYDPTWSPDGSKIAFVSERDGNPEIYLMNADGNGVTRLTNEPAVDRSPTFSPDGRKIAFASNRTGNFEIFVMNADGSGQQSLTQDPAAETQPAWSPDNELIAFVSEREGNPEIYTMRANGGQITRLTSHPAADVNPAWVADGQGLAFASNRDEGFELYLMPRAGGAVDRFTVSYGDSTQPNAGPR